MKRDRRRERDRREGGREGGREEGGRQRGGSERQGETVNKPATLSVFSLNSKP